MTTLTVAISDNVSETRIKLIDDMIDQYANAKLSYSDNGAGEMFLHYEFDYILDRDDKIKIARELCKEFRIRWYLFE